MTSSQPRISRHKSHTHTHTHTALYLRSGTRVRACPGRHVVSDSKELSGGYQQWPTEPDDIDSRVFPPECVVMTLAIRPACSRPSLPGALGRDRRGISPLPTKRERHIHTRICVVCVHSTSVGVITTNVLGDTFSSSACTHMISLRQTLRANRRNDNHCSPVLPPFCECQKPSSLRSQAVALVTSGGELQG